MMKRLPLCAALFILTLSAAAQRGDRRGSNSTDSDTSRDTTAESQDRKSGPGNHGATRPTPNIATPAPTASTTTPSPAPIITPDNSPKRAGKTKPKPSQEVTPQPAITPPPADETSAPDDATQPEDQGKKRGAGKREPKYKPTPTREFTSTTPAPADTPAPDESAKPEDATPTPATPDQTPADETPATSGHKHHKQPEPTPLPGSSPTPFIPAGPPPGSPASSATPTTPGTPSTQPFHEDASPYPPRPMRPVRTPSLQKQKNEKRRKPQPTPGPTPVPTPPTATPTPPSFHPPQHWLPFCGWQPPVAWRPPPQWEPEGGWVIPPGWRPPAGWRARLYKWGWRYVPGRGWVIRRGWRPPAGFVVPPGWYYLPPEEYANYGLDNPNTIQLQPGIARADLVEEIDTTQAYTPSDDVASEMADDEADTEAPERPLPDETPDMVDQASVDAIVADLTRERDDDNRYAGPVFVTQKIQFEDDGYAILPQSFAMLDALGEALMVPPLDEAIVSIETHMNGRLDDAQARQLTERRAWAVKGYLVQKFGMDPERLHYIGYGNDSPIAAHNTDDGLAMNERVEVENISDFFTVERVTIPDSDDASSSDTLITNTLSSDVSLKTSTATTTDTDSMSSGSFSTTDTLTDDIPATVSLHKSDAVTTTSR